MTSRRTWWFLFSAGAALVIAALVWITALVLRMEAQAAHEASVRLALYRMDFWLSPRIGRERLRPYFEYLPFYAQQRAYTRILNEIEPGEVITPSPLLTFESDVFLLHFQAGANGEITSPQVPTGNWRDLAEGGEEGKRYLEPGAIERRQPRLDRVRLLLQPPSLPPVRLDACVLSAETLLANLVGDNWPPAPPGQIAFQSSGLPLPPMPEASRQYAQSQQPKAQALEPNAQDLQQWASGNQQRAEVQSVISKADIGKRAASNYGSQQQEDSGPSQKGQVMMMPQKGAAIVDVDSVQVDELVPVWLPSLSDEQSVSPAVHDVAQPTTSSGVSDESMTLLLLRRVHIGAETVYQGILCDWPALQGALLDQIKDIFPEGRLHPEPNPSPALLESGRLLGSVPVTLEAPCPPFALGRGAALLTPARTTLALAWLAVLGAILAAGMTLRSSILYGEKRSRFASAVTHELRTPLTTFRMYSEMLAEGMVRDDSQRQTYLRTLQQESGRLSTLVENVLTYARLEEGRQARHVQAMTTAELIARVRGVLQRRAEDAGMQLLITDRTSGANIRTDAEVIEQILFNLVDNACKYASESRQKRIEFDIDRAGDRLCMAVRDHGPGISAEHERAIFKAFDRGAHGPGDTIPGVGLGLALSRGLARDLGGDLTFERPDNGGGCRFALRIPITIA
ncbi:MAG TPA: HAMP domain-containing sensor histidine kinase [Phycisphaerales bacterium]|nr:HAMP domain-containing sensor histidine kinase [Phycisphaerales bacterium]